MSLSRHLTLERLEVGLALLCGPVLAYEYHRWHREGSTLVLVLVAFLMLFIASNIVRGAKVLLKDTVVSTKDVADIAECLEREIKDEEKVRELASRLQALASGEQGAEAKREMVSTGAVEALMEAVQQHPQSQMAVNKCLAALIPLLSSSDAKATLQGSLPFHRALISVMDRSLTTLERSRDAGTSTATWECLVADVARQCCLLLGACVDGHRPLQTKAANAGAADAILRAMTWFPLHTELQKWALFALFNLTYEHGGNKVLLVGSGGLQRILTAMRTHVAALEVQRLGMATLYSVLQLRPPEDDDAGDSEEEEEEGKGTRAVACGQVGSMRAVALSNGLLEDVTP